MAGKELEGSGPIAPTVRKINQMHIGAQLTLFFLVNLTPQPRRWSSPHWELVFPPQLKSPGNTSTDTPTGASAT